jgi:putative addiction module killer protein
VKNEIEIAIFAKENGKEPFNIWLYDLDTKNKSRIIQRLNRLRLGNFGDIKYLDCGIYELRFDFGSGYRIYFGKDGGKLVILLCGGDKKTQNEDIKKAIKYWQEYLKI